MKKTIRKKTSSDTSSVTIQSSDISDKIISSTDVPNETSIYYVEISKRTPNILETKVEPIYSDTVIDIPLTQFGYTKELSEIKEKAGEVFKRFDGKKQVFRVVNPYERYIDNYDKSIGKVINNILSRAYYKLWEILITFPELIDNNNKNFRSAHIAEGPGSFIQACVNYRDKFSKHSKTDSYYGITLHSEDKLVPSFETNSFIPNINRYHQHKTYSLKSSQGDNSKDNGDITNPKTTKNFKKEINDLVDFVTADGGFPWDDEGNQEQEAYKLIFAEIYMALSIQNKGGSFVLKIFDTYCSITLKFILILNELYEKVYVCKPLTSRNSNSEKYIVCIGYKPNKKHLDELDKLYQSNFLNNRYLLDIFPTYEPSIEVKKQITDINITLGNIQFNQINKMIQFIEKNNYWGEEYEKYKNDQIIAHKQWLDKFYS